MRKFGKKLAAYTVAAVVALASLTGCSSETTLDPNEIVATVGDSEIPVGLLNFYVRYEQSAIESYYLSYYGVDMWSMEVEEGVTYGESVKEEILESLKQLYVLEDHASEYNVALTEEDMAAIETAVDAFDKANSEEAKEAISGQKEIVSEYFRLFALAQKVEDAMTADVDRNISDEEAAQKALQYVEFSKTKTDENGSTVKMTDDEIADVKKEAETFLAEAKASGSGSLEAYVKTKEKTSSKLTFDSETTTLGESVIKVADALEENAFADVLETDSAFYVIQLTSKFDKDATEAEKENMIAQRESEKYTEIFEPWNKAAEMKVNKDVMAKISLDKLGVTMKANEEEK